MAKRFQFAFDKLLRLSRQDLKSKETEMMRLSGELRTKEREIGRIDELIRDSRVELACALKATTGIHVLQSLNNYIMKLEVQKTIAARDLERLNFSFDRLKAAYIEKRKGVMAMEKLYAKRRHDYVRALDKEEQKFMDELAQRKI